MKKQTFLLLIVFLFLFNIGKAQGPHGSVSIDISNFIENIDTIYSREFAMDKNIPVIKWKSKDFQVYPTYGKIIWQNDSLRFNYTDNDLDFFHNHLNMLSVESDTIKQTLVITDFSTSLLNKSYHIIKIKKGKESQYIYIYNGDNTQFEVSKISSFIVSRWFLRGVFIEGLTFKPGTYLINLYDNKSPVLKKMLKDKDNKNKYIEIAEGDYIESSLVIKKEALRVSKISDEVYSPKDLEKFYKNRDIKRPKTVRKLLSTFEQK